MNEKIEKTANVSIEDMLFIDDIISENKIIINIPLIEVCGNDLTCAAMLTRYVFFYKHNNCQEFSLPDKKMAEYLHINLKTVERQKRLLKENGLISVRKVGLPAIGLITVNISIIRERYTFEESRTLKMRVLEPLKRGDIYNNIEESYIKEKENIKRNPVNGSPSSPDGDEFKEPEDAFESFWKNVQYKSQKVIARNEWNKITNNGKNQNKIKEVGEGYERYVSFLAKERARGFDRPHMDMSTFLNPSKMRWTEEWKTEREQRQEQQPTQTENQKYWEEHENTQVIASKKIEQPKDLERRIGIARKLNLLDRFLPDEYNNEWKFMPKEIKEILVSDAVEKVINDIKSKENSLIQQIACVTMLGREGYMRWKDEYEAETGERPTEDIEFYIPFGKKIQSDIWKWLLKYSHKFGLPSESKIDKVREWYNKKPLGPVWLLFS